MTTIHQYTFEKLLNPAIVCQGVRNISASGCLVEKADIVSVLKCQLRMTAKKGVSIISWAKASSAES